MKEVRAIIISRKPFTLGVFRVFASLVKYNLMWIRADILY